jgi:carbohydrate-selective porin OprB
LAPRRSDGCGLRERSVGRRERGVAFEAPFGREDDLVAIGVAWSDPSPGNGFRSETLVELFYRLEIARSITITPDLQLVFDLANNPDGDVVVVPGIRLHLMY